MKFGEPRIHYMVCESTNDSARDLAATGFPAGTVVTADGQSEGRGRQGRSWVAKSGTALLYSALLRPLEEHHRLLPLAVPIAVAEAAESAAAVTCQVKWPNDVLIEGRKCAGILIEARPEDGWAVIGVGINVNTAQEDFPEDIRATAVSLGPDVAVQTVLAELNERLGHWVDAKERDVLEAFRRRDALQGKEVSWDGGEGNAEGIDDAGNLLVSTTSGERVSLGAGEVHLKVG
jgi:BirA family biotin operon repressor/biotin-[acetyl-CoA-carboxylase] ligase